LAVWFERRLGIRFQQHPGGVWQNKKGTIMSGALSQSQAFWDFVKRNAVWLKGTPIDGYDSLEWRRDFEGHAIRWSDYGDQSSVYGWQIDHIVPEVVGGGDYLDNLRPRHWRSNQAAGGALSSALALGIAGTWSGGGGGIFG
jgi:hypothetical protein